VKGTEAKKGIHHAGGPEGESSHPIYEVSLMGSAVRFWKPEWLRLLESGSGESLAGEGHEVVHETEVKETVCG
jgi:hypothetical protein